MSRGLTEWLRGGSVWAVSFGLYQWLGGGSLQLVWVACTILLIAGGLQRLLPPTRLSVVHLTSPEYLEAGDAVQITVQVKLRSILPLPWLLITDQIGDRQSRKLLFPGWRRTLEYSYEFNSMTRGIWPAVECKVEWGDLFGWFRASRNVRSHGNGLTVLPRPVRWLYTPSMLGSGDLLQGQSVEAERLNERTAAEWRGPGVRDYTPGDPMNRIHWKNSAKLGRLQTLTSREDHGRRQGIILDTHVESYRKERGKEPEDAFESAVSAVTGFVHDLVRQRTPFTLWVVGTGITEPLIEYTGASDSRYANRLFMPLASVQLSAISDKELHAEDAADMLEGELEWAIVSGDYQERAAMIGLQRLNAGSRHVTIYCTQPVQEIEHVAKEAFTSPYRNQHPSQHDTAGDFIRRGGQLVYVHHEPLSRELAVRAKGVRYEAQSIAYES
ncbi:DUF58 domain-containing protein [Paenibacillus sp. JCM 10914]|uniref:DUF58 domain-containing protein n=1 Tax=Paenibacillus sp. JCM 10914 TaxID=1236974 RepID=UPI0003CC64D5|nr:DUF58 domain-containing protein [Paenibacillus sp. JCM 10914]GAE08277.1 hypothetical protein JCM10914_4567 [Paenibacillus sp. JCM 10914]